MSAYKNLALHEYRKREDEAVRSELIAAGIPFLDLNAYLASEVKTRYIGLLNGFVFARSWRYWICEGDIPLGLACKIYDQLHHLAVRAECNANNSKPRGYAPSYKKLLEEKAEELKAQSVPSRQVAEELSKIVEDPNAERFVRFYHIDTSEGLKALADYIKEHNIYACNGKEGSYAAYVYRQEEAR